MFTESTTRAECVDKQLAKAGWSSSGRILVQELWLPREALTADEIDSRDGSHFVDYALLLPDGRPIVVVEAKRSSRAALEGERQAAEYADSDVRKILHIVYVVHTVVGQEGAQLWALLMLELSSLVTSTQHDAATRFACCSRVLPWGANH